VGEDHQQGLHVHILRVARLDLWQKLVDVVVLLDFLEDGDFIVVLSADGLELEGLGEDQGYVLGNQVLVQTLTIGSFIFNQDTVLVLGCRVSKVNVEEAGHYDQKDEEGAAEDGNLVFGLQQELGQGDRNVVGSGAVGVAILLEVLIGNIVGQNL
jgi:hypothetical protein